MNWDTLFAEYEALRTSGMKLAFARKYLAHLPKSDSVEFRWFIDALEDDRKKWFVAALFEHRQPIPDSLFHAMIRAAVYEPDPSFNARFIVPLFATYTNNEVARELFPYLKDGTLNEKIGAANAYWYVYDGPPQGEMARKVWSCFLRLFVENDNIELRRSLVVHLKPIGSWYSEDDRPLLQRYIDIASSSEDAYIMNRWQIHPARPDPNVIIPIMRKP